MLTKELTKLRDSLVTKPDRASDDDALLTELNQLSEAMNFVAAASRERLEMYGGPLTACPKCLRPF